MSSRAQHLRTLRDTSVVSPLDVLILGGGINGAVSAAALSDTALRVGLVERGDFASQTSQASSNMVWGGIKYLESGELRLVRDLCRSRNELCRSFPDNVREIRFRILCDQDSPRPPWQLYLGTWLYWLMGNCRTLRPRCLGRQKLGRMSLIRPEQFRGGVEYSDAYLPETDARFTLHFIAAAWQRGCAAVNYVQAAPSRHEGGLWRTPMVDLVDMSRFEVCSRTIVNACGPWSVEQAEQSRVQTRSRLALSKGVHLIVPRLMTDRCVLSFFSSDGRPIFVLPLGKHTCVGTTDTKTLKPTQRVLPEDRRFILSNINRLLQLNPPLTEADIIAERCGVRPLVVESETGDQQDWMNLSRKHAIEVDKRGYLSILGGKLTDCLNIGEEVRQAIQSLGLSMTASQSVWYGEPSAAQRQLFLDAAAKLGLDRPAQDGWGTQAERLWRRYGAQAESILARIAASPQQGKAIMPDNDVMEAEVHHIAEQEMCVTMEDFLRRRTTLAQTHRHQQLQRDPGLNACCRILFGANADNLWQQFTEYPPAAHPIPDMVEAT